MAGGKLSPRQKMINMMYLVLTALLALNVSKEIINSFVIINKGLEQTMENFAKKNSITYANFDFQEKINQAKVKPYNDKAKTVRKLSEDVIMFIEGIKKDIMAKAENLDKKGRDSIKLEAVEAKDENNIPTEILIGQGDKGDKGQARQIKNRLIEYKDKLKAIVTQVDKVYAAKMNLPINTENPPKNKEGILETWESQYFHTVPLAPAVTILTKLQNDVRNAEAEVINFLFSKIDASDFKFDTLAAKVIPKSSYVVIGQEYEADVFVAAFSTTQNPQIIVGTVDTTKNEMIGRGDSIPVDRGVGKYKTKPSSEGVQKWGGLIRVKSPDGTVKAYAFKSEYISAKPNAVVSPDKMNVLYMGIPNPISISVAGIAADKVTATISQGSLPASGKKGTYNASVTSLGKATITVWAEIEGKKQNMGSFEFRVKKIPDPVVQVAGKEGGMIGKAMLGAQGGVFAVLKDFDFDGVNYKVTSFKMTLSGKGRDVLDAVSNSNIITEDMKSKISKARLGDNIYFEEVKVVGPDGITRPLGSAIKFTIN